MFEEQMRKMICPKRPSLRRLVSLCRVLSDRRCRPAATVPTTASGLSRGCRGAAGCAKEARIPVSMVTSPPRAAPLQRHCAAGGEGEEVEGRKEHFRGGAWEKSALVYYLWSPYGSLGGWE